MKFKVGTQSHITCARENKAMEVEQVTLGTGNHFVVLRLGTE